MELEPCEVGSNRVTFLWCVTYEKVTFGQLPEFCVPEMWDRRNGAYKKSPKAPQYPIKGEIGETGPTRKLVRPAHWKGSPEEGDLFLKVDLRKGHLRTKA